MPRPRRVHGYFAMPLLAGGRLMGRVDPAREGRTLVARQLSLRGAKAARPMAQALREAAEWVGCDDVRVERINREDLRAALSSALREELAQRLPSSGDAPRTPSRNRHR